MYHASTVMVLLLAAQARNNFCPGRCHWSQHTCLLGVAAQVQPQFRLSLQLNQNWQACKVRGGRCLTRNTCLSAICGLATLDMYTIVQHE